MRKVMYVKLVTTFEVENEGSRRSTCEWTLPYESLGQEERKGVIEQEMMELIGTVFEEDQMKAIDHMMYGALSAGGSISQNGSHLTVEFRKDRGHGA